VLGSARASARKKLGLADVPKTGGHALRDVLAALDAEFENNVETNAESEE
jgi:hypothetical protein